MRATASTVSEQDLQPGVSGAERASRHGFVRGVDFDVAHWTRTTTARRWTLRTARSVRSRVIPTRSICAIIFTLDAGGLTLEARMRNVGDSAAPCFFGWHPYFRLAASSLVDGWQLQIPAQTLIRTDAELIALPGAAAYVPLDDAPALDFREARPIGDRMHRPGLYRPAGRQRRPHPHLSARSGQRAGYRGMAGARRDACVHRRHHQPDARQSVALEPMECMANAFNRHECAEAIRLEPGAERRFRCGVEVECT